MSSVLSMAGTAAEDVDIGARLRSMREAKRYTQRDLAKRTGISNGTISMIEQNKVSPSIAVIKKLLHGLSMSLAEFFDDGENVSEQIFFTHAELTELVSGDITLKQVGRNLPNRSLQLMYDTYKPGADSGEAMLAHDGEEGGFIVRGYLEVTVRGETRVLGPGDAYRFDSRLPHRFRNIGTEDCVIISAATPPTF
jgi:transcriptional regulator with XRE-family HTH domain